jgi:hypothetical protein
MKQLDWKSFNKIRHTQSLISQVMDDEFRDSETHDCRTYAYLNEAWNLLNKCVKSD